MFYSNTGMASNCKNKGLVLPGNPTAPHQKPHVLSHVESDIRFNLTRWQQPVRRAPISEEQPATNHQGQEESAYKQRCFVFCILHETNQCFPLSEQQVSEASAARKCRSTFLPPPDKPDLTQEKQKGPKLQFS